MIKPHVGGIFSRGILVTRSALHLGMRAAQALEVARRGDKAAIEELQRLTNAALLAASHEVRQSSRRRTWRR